MICPVCKRDNGPDVVFCEGCGRRIPRCPTCGLELTCRDRFCSNDGTRLSDDLLLLVPEESVLQEPVWSRPAPVVQTQQNDVDSTMRADPVSYGEETVRATPISAAPKVRNSDPGSAAPSEQAIPSPRPPQRAFCESCGKRIAVGNRFCANCLKAQTDSRDSGKKLAKIILIILLVLLLLAGLFAGGYAVLNSDLFDWDTTSSNRAEKEDDEDEDDEEPATDDAVAETPEDATDIPTEGPSAGVEDPVETQAPTETVPVDTTEETTAPTESAATPLMYWIDNCDKMYLTEEHLAGFDKQMCVYARNAIFAKSGRKFNSTELQQYFSQFAWYHPTIRPDQFSNSMFNSYQNANLNLILEYERAHGYN